MLEHQAAQALLEHVGIDLGRRDIGVPEALLNDSEIGPAIEQSAFEVGDEVRDRFVQARAANANAFARNERGR